MLLSVGLSRVIPLTSLVVRICGGHAALHDLEVPWFGVCQGGAVEDSGDLLPSHTLGRNQFAPILRLGVLLSYLGLGAGL